jgi:hypothetical protein
VRPLGPGTCARISSFLSTHFTSRGTKPSTFRIRSLQKFLLVRVALFLLGAAIPTPGLAQSLPTAAFRFSKEVHWGSAVLQPGDYLVWVSSGSNPKVRVDQKDGDFAAIIAPRQVSSEQFSGNTRIVVVDDGSGAYVTSLYVKDVQALLTFAAPAAAQDEPTNPTPQKLPRQNAISADSAPQEASLFSIDNPRRQAWPSAEAQRLYLSACKAVEQEFGRTDPIRPRVTLVLGASANGVYFPKHEVQLTKWDKYQFAQGVIMLAVDELLPLDMKMSLTKLAVSTADSTVGVDELKK